MLATLGLHLLLAWSWRIAHPPARDAQAERIIELVPVAPPRQQAPQLRPDPPPPRTGAAAPRARSAPPPAAASAPEAITPPAEAPAPAADPFAAETPAAAPAPSTLDAMVGRARRDALAIDREFRKGKSGVPDAPDTSMARFAGALEAAYIDRGRSVTSETYTAPDGQVIYRFRRNGRYMCRSGGGVGPKIGGAVGGGEVLFDVQGGAGRAGEVPCPSHAQWKRD